jgi:hypothetical protein
MFQIRIRAFRVRLLCFSKTLAIVPLEDFRPPSFVGPETVHLAVS